MMRIQANNTICTIRYKISKYNQDLAKVARSTNNNQNSINSKKGDFIQKLVSPMLHLQQ